MAVNLVSNYSGKVAERFKMASLTEGAFNRDFEFTGIKTLKVFSIETAPMNDYSRSGSSRYGTPADLGDTVQEMTMTQDKSFTFVIDRGDNSEQLNIKSASRCLRRQIDERVIPMVDKYRFQKWAEKGGSIAAISAPTKSTVVELVMDGNAALTNALAPLEGRKLFIGVSYYKLLKQNPEFISVESLGKQALAKGKVGEVDGCDVIPVPDGRLPDNVYFIIVHKCACLSPVKLQDYKVHKDPPGYSGDLAEGRITYDAFVIGSKADAIYVAAASSYVCSKPTAALDTTLALATSTIGATIMYTTDGTDPRFSSTAHAYSSALTVTSGETVRAYALKSGMFNSGVLTYTVA